MNGRYLLDTNAIINLLKDENSQFNFIGKKGVYFVSIITEIELLSFKNLTKEDETSIYKLLPEASVINIDIDIKNKTIELKKKKKLKLPDALICATALVRKLTLVTEDKDLLNIPALKTAHLSEFLSRIN
jgi:predicted nucleic acid-binding protein